MTPPFHRPLIHAVLLGAAMGTAYLLGRAQALTKAQEGQPRDSTPAQSEAAEAVAWQARVRRMTAEERASMAFDSDAQAPADAMMHLTTRKIGNVMLSVNGEGQYFIGKIAIGELMQLDPKQALLELAKLPHGAETNAAYRDAFDELFETGLMEPITKPGPDTGPAAVALAAALPDGRERSAALLGLVNGWSTLDKKAALAWAGSLPAADEPVLEEAIMCATGDPAVAVQYVGNLTNASDRNAVIEYIADAWGAGGRGWDLSQVTDPAAALDWLDHVATGAAYDESVESIFATLACYDPATGAALLGKLTDPADRSAAIAQLTQYWGDTQPQAALDWLQTLPDSDRTARTNAINAVVSGWSNQNLAGAAAYVSSATDPAVFLATAPILAPAMAKTDPQTALNWVNGFPDSPTKAQAVSGVLANLAVTDFNGAWSYASNLPAGVTRDGAMDSVVSALSASNPAQAATLLGQLGTDAASLSATQSVAANWAQLDPAALSAWINTQPAGAVRDAAVAQYVSAQTVKDPSAAYVLANTLDDPSTRADQVKMIILAWANHDLPGATAAAQSANLTDSQRANLLILLSQGNGQ